MEIGIGIVEVLRDRPVGPGFHFLFEIEQV
jgi:hypothetical protein